MPVLAAPLTDLLRDGPSAPVWRPIQDPAQQVAWHTWPRSAAVKRLSSAAAVAQEEVSAYEVGLPT
ncbi:hypothetical protein FHS35_002084 [Streptomyces umbrinus]|uniref:hypothetical protein n=1 Tax=Streptomyces umbrinus TaxID=67370 RepID=UPI001998EF8D|nr:hypothetical protein [Streptomyces umbrinus]MCR3725236.1 hypothetical protein [Streptomyces umbrinus]GHH63389.1 hypothetical protein GCM10018775_81070 [Streptomyces umbrinus]